MWWDECNNIYQNGILHCHIKFNQMKLVRFKLKKKKQTVKQKKQKKNILSKSKVIKLDIILPWQIQTMTVNETV